MQVQIVVSHEALLDISMIFLELIKEIVVLLQTHYEHMVYIQPRIHMLQTHFEQVEII